jgi:hypothetical protein
MFVRAVTVGCFDQIQRLGRYRQILLGSLRMVIVPQSDELAGPAGQIDIDISQISRGGLVFQWSGIPS